MRIMSGGRTAAGIAVLTALTLGLTACGGDDKADEPAAAAGTDAAEFSECAATGGNAIRIPGAVVIYQYDQNEKTLALESYGSTDALVKDPELKALNKQFEADIKDFDAAKDNTARTKILNETKPRYEQYATLCKDKLSDDEKALYLRFAGQEPYPTSLDKKDPSAPESSKAEAPSPSKKAPKKVDLTAPGATVKVGQPVYFEFTDDKGRKGSAKMTVTKVEYPGDDALKHIEKDSRDKIGRLAYVRATVEATEETKARDFDDLPNLTYLLPSFDVQTDDGSDGGFLLGMGGFDNCKDDSGYGDKQSFCKVFPLAKKSTKVSAVELEYLRSSDDGGPKPLYTWTN